LKLAVGIAHALWKLFIIMPDVIFSKGGYGALPTLIAGRIFRIPVLIHDSDAIPGVVTQWSAKFAKRIAISYASAAAFFSREKIALTGTPIRKRALGGNPDEARELLGVYSNDSVLFFIGGSQGAQKINDALIGILPELLKKYEIIHHTGKANYEDVWLETRPIEEKIPKGKYHPIAFLSEPQLRAAYTIADLVISRASSGIFEIAAAGKPAILIPIKKSAQDHQRENAYQYAKTGAAVVVEEDNLTPHLLLNEIEKLIGDTERLQKMSANAQKFARVDAATLIAEEILKLGIHN
jgi:UDP-N-acetylglucosamine--N-acetylmuramyl-(pentapeptide) pyrophosphoryl-undecaprenol N-acetylglucosamine transferase